MSRPLPIFLLLLAYCLVIAGCRDSHSHSHAGQESSYHTPEELSIATPKPAVAAANAFGLNLSHKLTDKPENVFISPTSLMLALAMTYNGAGGATKAEMAKVLQISGIPTDELNTELSALQKDLQEGDPQVQVEIANSLWASRGYTFKPPFVKVCQNSYEATLDSLDFGSPDALRKINGWANEKTHGLIPKIVTREDLVQAALLLMDAVYFKGKWSNPFEEEDTQKHDFTTLAGRKKTVQMMEREGAYIYTEDKGLQAIALPYGEGRMNMIVVLPHEKQGLGAMLKSTDDKTWRKLLQRMTIHQGTIELPRFEIAYEAYLNDALKAMGMTTIFDRADFTPMADGLDFLSFVKHKSFLRVTEKKTEAAAVAVPAPGGPGMAPPPLPTSPFEMIVDHPFLLGIVDTKTGATLFLGAIVDPQETRAGE